MSDSVSGHGTFHDDRATITDSEVVYRRIYPDFIDWAIIDEYGFPRIMSGGFQDYSEKIAREKFGLPGACMSVGIHSILVLHGFGAAKLVEDYPSSYGVARLVAEALRTLTSQTAQSDVRQGIMPWATGQEPWHGVVFNLNARKKSKPAQDAIARLAQWEVPPARE